MPERRRLAFGRIAEIMPEVEHLIAGYASVGRWSLGAICDHLARAVVLALDSAPADAPPTREQAVYRRLFFRSGAFPESQTPPIPALFPDPNADPIIAAGSLRKALDRLDGHAGPFAAHPVIGPLTREEWLLFHSRHAAHHLSFSVPR